MSTFNYQQVEDRRICNDIIDLNNKGAASIAMKKFRRANDRLLDALAICSEALRNLPHVSTMDDGEQSSFINHTDAEFTDKCIMLSPPCRFIERDNWRQPCDHLDAMIDETQTNDQGPQVTINGGLYAQAIRMPSITATDTTVSSSSPLPSYSVLASIVIFNLGLAVQFGALEEQKTSAMIHDDGEASNSTSMNAILLDQFIKSIRLYEMAYDLQKEHDTPLSIVLLAVVNNLGQAYKAIGDLETADHCFKHLLSLLMVCVCYTGYPYGQPNSNDHINHSLSGLPFETFFGNAMNSMARDDKHPSCCLPHAPAA
jgi:tetratricopeptide (TPR) repeat protein